MTNPSKRWPNFKRVTSAVFYGAVSIFLYVTLLLNGFWGLRTGRVAYPVGRGEIGHIARSAHPLWFWIVEAADWLLALLITAAAGAVAYGSVRKPSRRPTGEPKTPDPTTKRSATRAASPMNASVASAARPTARSPQPEKKTRFPADSSDLRSSSPGGRCEIRVYPYEIRMSHWIETPEVIDTVTNRCLFRPLDDQWSLLSAVWESESVVTLRLRRYPGSVEPSYFETQLDCAKLTASVGGVEVENLGKVEHHLGKAYKAGRKH